MHFGCFAGLQSHFKLVLCCDQHLYIGVHLQQFCLSVVVQHVYKDVCISTGLSCSSESCNHFVCLFLCFASPSLFGVSLWSFCAPLL